MGTITSILEDLADAAIAHPKTVVKKLTEDTFTISIHYDFFSAPEIEAYIDEKTAIWVQHIPSDIEMPCPATELRHLIKQSFRAHGAEAIYGGWAKNTFYISAENAPELAELLDEKCSTTLEAAQAVVA